MLLDKYGNPLDIENFNKVEYGAINIANSYQKQNNVIIYNDNNDNNNNKWVNWGKNNLEPQELNYYSIKSPILDGILEKEMNRIFGDMLVYEDTNEKLDSKHPMFYSSPGVKLEKFIKSLISDMSRLSTYSFSVEYTLNKKRIANLYYIPASTIRSGKQNRTGKVNRYYISNNWSSINKYNGIKPKSIGAFNPEKAGPAQLYYYKTQNPNNFYYSKVSWESVLDWVIMDYEIAQYHLSDVKNGMSPGLIVSYNNDVSDPVKAKKIKQNFIEQYQGPENASKMVMLFSPSKDAAPTITQLESSKNDERFKDLNNQINEKIVIGTGIPRILSGLETSVGLSNGAQALELAEQVWFKNEISTKRNTILESLNTIMDFNKYPRINLINKTPNLLSNGLSDNILTNNFTQDEIRESVGRAPLTNKNNK